MRTWRCAKIFVPRFVGFGKACKRPVVLRLPVKHLSIISITDRAQKEEYILLDGHAAVSGVQPTFGWDTTMLIHARSYRSGHRASVKQSMSVSNFGMSR